MTTNFVLLGVMGASAAAVLGCQKEEPISDADYDAVAQNVALLMDDEEASSTDSLKLAKAEASGFSAQGAGSFSREVRNGSASLTYSYTLECLDEGATVPSACDPDTTDSASLTVNWEGSLDTTNWDIAATRTGNWTLSDIQSDTAQFNGTGTFELASSGVGLFGARRTLDLSYAAQYDAVLIDTADRRLTGGSITYEVHVRRTREGVRASAEAEFDVTAEVEITGPGEATITLDGSRHYNVNVTTGTVVTSE